MGRILATGSRNGDLYALDGNMAAALVAIKSGKAPQDIWHERLGHLHSRLLKVSSSNNGIDVSSWSKPSTICSSCQIGNSCKLPCQLNYKIEVEPFQEVHCDLSSRGFLFLTY